MNMKDTDAHRFVMGKWGTGRPVNFKIRLNDWKKVISDRNIGFWAKIKPNREIIKTIGELTDEEIKMLGFSSIEEYLAEPYNKGLTRNSKKKFIFWDEYEIYWSKILQILTK